MSLGVYRRILGRRHRKKSMARRKSSRHPSIRSSSSSSSIFGRTSNFQDKPPLCITKTQLAKFKSYSAFPHAFLQSPTRHFLSWMNLPLRSLTKFSRCIVYQHFESYIFNVFFQSMIVLLASIVVFSHVTI